MPSGPALQRADGRTGLRRQHVFVELEPDVVDRVDGGVAHEFDSSLVDLFHRALQARHVSVNCSHEAASQQLGVHRKTIAHRLARIADLTGLDLSTHDDRLVADLSLYVHRLLESQKPPAPTP